MYPQALRTLVLGLALSTIAALPLAAQEGADAPVPIDDAIAVDRLKVVLRPKTEEALQASLEAWMQELKSRAAAVSAAEIAGLDAEGEEAAAAAQEAVKSAVAARDALVLRLRAVLEEAEAKGVDVAPRRRYVARVTEAATRVQDAETPRIEVVDVNDASITERELDLQVKPLPKEDLERLAKTWQGILRSKAQEIAAAEITKLKAEGDAQEAAIERAAKLREERAQITARYVKVLDALEAKGGDVTSQRVYLKEVTGTAFATEDLTDVDAVWAEVKAWALSTEGGIRWAANFFKFFVVLVLALIASRILGRIAYTAVSRVKSASQLLKNFVVRSVRSMTKFVGLLIALAMLEVPISPFIAAIGAAGLVIGLALQGTLSNFAAGILILIYRPYDIGNFIDAGGAKGSVDAMNVFSTTLKTPDNQIVVVPNGRIWGGTITNVTGAATRRVDLTFGIGYGEDVDRAREVLLEVVNAHDLVMKDPAPAVELSQLADSSVNFVVRPWVKTSDYWRVYWDLTTAVKKRFDQEGIEIPFPQRQIHMSKAD